MYFIIKHKIRDSWLVITIALKNCKKVITIFYNMFLNILNAVIRHHDKKNKIHFIEFKYVLLETH